LKTVVKSNLAWGSWSGHNSRFLRQFADKFDSGEGKTIFGVLLDIDRNFVGSANSRMRVRIWSGADMPSNILYDKEIKLSDFAGGKMNFIQFDSAVNVTGNFFAGYQLFYGSPQDTFSLKMADNRTDNHINTAFVQDGVTWYTLDDYTMQAVHSSFAIMPVVYDFVDGETQRDRNIIYPNPATNNFRIEFPEISESESVLNIYNITGQIIYSETFPPYNRVITVTGLSSLSPGFYIVKVKRGNYTSTFRLVIVR